MQNKDRLDITTIGIFILTAIGVLFSLSAVALFLLVIVITLFRSGFSSQVVFVYFALSLTSLTTSILLLPSLINSFSRLIGRSWSIPWLQNNRFVTPGLGVLLLVLLISGEFISRQQTISWLLLPPIQLLVVAIPLWLLVDTASRGLVDSNRQRRWDLLSISLAITPTLVTAIEIALLGVLFVLLVAWLMTQPQMVRELSQFSRDLSNLRNLSQAEIIAIAQPILENPATILGILGVGAGLIPIIEELLKPIAAWILAFKKPTPAQGFIAGLISGSAFALLESLGSMTNSFSSGWAVLAVGRMGTGILHTTTAALMGWGIASLFSEKKYFRLPIVFIIAVAMHCTWNTFSLLSGLSTFITQDSLMGTIAYYLAQASPFVLVSLAVLFLVILLFSSWYVRRSSQASLPPQAAQ